MAAEETRCGTYCRDLLWCMQARNDSMETILFSDMLPAWRRDCEALQLNLSNSNNDGAPSNRSTFPEFIALQVYDQLRSLYINKSYQISLSKKKYIAMMAEEHEEAIFELGEDDEVVTPNRDRRIKQRATRYRNERNQLQKQIVNMQTQIVSMERELTMLRLKCQTMEQTEQILLENIAVLSAQTDVPHEFSLKLENSNSHQTQRLILDEEEGIEIIISSEEPVHDPVDELSEEDWEPWRLQEIQARRDYELATSFAYDY